MPIETCNKYFEAKIQYSNIYNKYFEAEIQYSNIYAAPNQNSTSYSKQSTHDKLLFIEMA